MATPPTWELLELITAASDLRADNGLSFGRSEGLQEQKDFWQSQFEDALADYVRETIREIVLARALIDPLTGKQSLHFLVRNHSLFI